jgi:hypothetical protein
MKFESKKIFKEISAGDIKYQNPKKIDKKCIDKKLRKIIRTINKSNWCYTLWSCQGHIYDNESFCVPYITFILKNKYIGNFFCLLQNTLLPYKNNKFPVLGNGNLLINKGYGNNVYTIYSVYWSEDYLKNNKCRKHMFLTLKQMSRKIKDIDGK